MTADQRFALTMAAIGVLSSLIGWAIRLLWKIATVSQRDRDATAANTMALNALDSTMRALAVTIGALSERVARLEGSPARGFRGR